MAGRSGWAGPALALGLLIAAGLAAWLALVAPLLAWHDARAMALADRRMLAQRLEALAAELPALRLTAAAQDEADGAVPLSLEGGSDAIAGAALQGLVQGMALRAGATLSSIETLPALPVGAHRRIGLRLSLMAPWPVLVGLLQEIAAAAPRMLVDDLELEQSPMAFGADQAVLGTSFALYAFRAERELRAGP